MKWFLKCLKQYAETKGRASRQEYWMFVLFSIIFLVVVVLIDMVIDPNLGESEAGTLTIIYEIALFIPSFCVGVRRMHDVGKSGEFIFIPIYNLILALKPGEEGKNKYGPNPNK